MLALFTLGAFLAVDWNVNALGVSSTAGVLVASSGGAGDASADDTLSTSRLLVGLSAPDGPNLESYLTCRMPTFCPASAEVYVCHLRVCCACNRGNHETPANTDKCSCFGRLYFKGILSGHFGCHK